MMNVTWIQLDLEAAAPSWAWALGILILMSTLSQVTWLPYVLVTVIYVRYRRISMLDIVG